MTAYEVFIQLQGILQAAVPQADFRESYGPGAASRLPLRPVAAGQVGEETDREGRWSARIDYTLFLPRGAGAAVGEDILQGIGRAARGRFPALAGISRGAFAPDKSTGLLAAKLSLQFAEEKAGAGQAVVIGGTAYPAAGWEIRCAPGKGLTAIGEGEPFAVAGGMEYTVEVAGIETAGLERLAGFTAVLGDLAFAGCRWKSLSATGKRAVFTSTRMEREEGEHGEP